MHAEHGKLGSFSLGNRAPLVDADADALPDDWEQQRLGTLAYGADDDPGGVGYPLLASYQQGLNPWPEATVSDGLRAWYRADLGVVRDGDKVSQWVDVSGHGFHVLQADPDRQPFWTAAAFNGQPALSYDAHARMALETNAPVDLHAGSTDITVIAVIQPEDTQPDLSTLLDFTSISPTDPALAGFRWRQGEPGGYRWAPNRYYLGWAPEFGVEYRTPGLDAVPQRVQILSAVKSGESATDYLDGAGQGTRLWDTAAMTVPVAHFAVGNGAHFTLGNIVIFPERGFHGRIAEILAYNRALSDAERGLIEAALRNKYIPPDTDADGLPDAWEDQQFGTRSYTAADDPGGVGRTLLESFQQGLSPWQAPVVENGLRAWYRADAGVVTDAANSVARWTDVSGHGFHVSPALQNNDEPASPQWIADAINGCPALHYEDSGAMTLETRYPVDVQAGSSDLTVIAAVRPSANPSACAPTEDRSCSTILDLSWIGAGGFHWWRGLPGSVDHPDLYYLGWEHVSNPNFELGTPGLAPVAARVQVLSVVKDGTSATDYLDGAAQGTYVAPAPEMTAPVARLALGNTAGYPVRSFDGDIAEVLIYNRGLSDAERAAIERELLAKYRANFSLSMDPTTLSINQGGSAVATAIVTPVDGFTGSVTLSVTGLPDGLTALFGPNPTASTSTLTLSASAGVAPGAYTLTVTGISGKRRHTTTLPVTVGAVPVIESFTASPSSILYGDTSTLTGVFSGGSGSVNNGIGALVSGVGRSTPVLTTATTYTLTVTNAAGASVTANATVTVSAVSISAVTPGNPTVTVGTSTTFTATVTGAVNTGVNWTASCGTITAAGAWTAPSTPGSCTITATAAADGTTSRSTTATVVAAPVIASFTASPGSILNGAASTLTGVFSGGSGSVNNGIGALVSGVGRSTPALTTTTTYTLTVTNAAGASVTADAAVAVSPVAVSAVTPSNPTVTVGTSTTFNATVTGAVNTGVNWTASCGTITAAGVWTAPSTPATCTITATAAADGTTSRSTTATVVAAPVIASFTASPGSILNGAASTLTGVFSGGSGSVNNGIGALVSGVGRSTPALTTATTYTLTVTNAAGASVSANATVTVSAVSISAVTPGNPTVTVGTSTTFTATVTGAVNTGVNWTASCGTITAAGAWTAPSTPGSCTITATAAANGTTSRSTTATVVAAADFNVAISPSTVSIVQGQSGTATANVSPRNGFAGAVTFSVTGMPSGMTASFSPNPTTTTSTLTLTVGSTAVPGTYALTVTGVGGGLTRSAPLTLLVTALDCTLSVSPASVSIGQGQSGTATVTVTQVNGVCLMNLGVTGLPSGVSASFSPNPTSNTSTLTLTVGFSAALGTHALTVTGANVSGAPTRAASLSLTVSPPPVALSIRGDLGYYSPTLPGPVNCGLGYPNILVQRWVWVALSLQGNQVGDEIVVTGPYGPVAYTLNATSPGRVAGPPVTPIYDDHTTFDAPTCSWRTDFVAINNPGTYTAQVRRGGAVVASASFYFSGSVPYTFPY